MVDGGGDGKGKNGAKGGGYHRRGGDGRDDGGGSSGDGEGGSSSTGGVGRTGDLSAAGSSPALLAASSTGTAAAAAVVTTAAAGATSRAPSPSPDVTVTVRGAEEAALAATALGADMLVGGGPITGAPDAPPLVPATSGGSTLLRAFPQPAFAPLSAGESTSAPATPAAVAAAERLLAAVHGAAAAGASVGGASVGAPDELVAGLQGPAASSGSGRLRPLSPWARQPSNEGAGRAPETVTTPAAASSVDGSSKTAAEVSAELAERQPTSSASRVGPSPPLLPRPPPVSSGTGGGRRGSHPGRRRRGRTQEAAPLAMDSPDRRGGRPARRRAPEAAPTPAPPRRAWPLMPLPLWARQATSGGETDGAQGVRVAASAAATRALAGVGTATQDEHAAGEGGGARPTVAPATSREPLQPPRLAQRGALPSPAGRAVRDGGGARYRGAAGRHDGSAAAAAAGTGWASAVALNAWKEKTEQPGGPSPGWRRVPLSALPRLVPSKREATATTDGKAAAGPAAGERGGRGPKRRRHDGRHGPPPPPPPSPPPLPSLPPLPSPSPPDAAVTGSAATAAAAPAAVASRPREQYGQSGADAAPPVDEQDPAPPAASPYLRIAGRDAFHPWLACAMCGARFSDPVDRDLHEAASHPTLPLG